MRKEPMDVLIKSLVKDKTPEQHIVVIAGLGGSGKTQLTLKFARDFEDRYVEFRFRFKYLLSAVFSLSFSSTRARLTTSRTGF
jgi:KaiC/GvpD/RAD55 family RecA-like ATPase